MARCIPDTIPQRLHVKSEARLFERLRQELPDDYVLLHSLNIPGKRPGSDVESDFVLLHPKCRLVLEVKWPNTGSGRYSSGADTKRVDNVRIWYQADLVTA